MVIFMKITVINEIDNITDLYCDGCFLKRQLAKDKGKTGAHQFCISKCTIGEHLQFLGREMSKISK